MQCSKLIEILEQLAPEACACDWDNVGLLAGSSKKEIKKVLIALDGDESAIEEAVRLGADLLLTHHPLIFKPLKRINDSDFIAERLMKLIRNDICCYAMHTNFDAAPGCMADAAAGKMELQNTDILEKEGSVTIERSQGFTELPFGIGKTGYLKQPLTVRELAGLVKERFGLPFVTIYGEQDIKEPVSFVGISPGAGSGMIKPALKAGVQVLITGDIGYHSGTDAAANHMAVIDAGHYGLEYLFLEFMEDFLKKKTGEELEVYKADVRFPETFL
ncbi:Nif3-like dinuclear metal center hexameric protein [Clostridium boliviensis]|uniref:GTP cyclohydrolase 1 type 2 homolog n=1 Tax=Clostridium boliviensis TaxID=318465 RepID=A0ABU4GMN6_9CLOT|nr:Nif3-like dinuclear metal center hexameric protein [Clostridium boliviensis]MDW2798865.1 Nif3-like dinuclear metal center hexameric protein [Clostridium boliviensis]